METITKERIAALYQQAQDAICARLEQADGKSKFVEEIWEREGGGGGRTRILQHGNAIEKGGVNFSAVHGELPEKIMQALQVKDNRFFATGVSVVQHPVSPMVPIIHMNVRYFELGTGEWWFGGGIDLTPHYIVEEDARWFHEQLKSVCDKYDVGYYPRFKAWADDYFFIQHRGETRGVGGIFYDRQKGDGSPEAKKRLLDFSLELAGVFGPIYAEMIERNRNKTWTEREKQWQLLRRGRYVEFNLVYDKGTKFGLDT
ncbi:MAG: oxygen-dependent coproporphyrinogen oxidase, partial [Bacteroidia bacterium]